MRHKAGILAAAVVLSVTGCRLAERLTFIRPDASRGKYTQVAPTYDVSGAKGKAVARDPSQLLGAANALYQSGQLAEAEKLALQALKLEPGSGDAHTLLGAIDDARGAAESAGKHFRQATALSPQNGIYANNYGTWLCSNGRAGESLAWFDRAVADPSYPTRAAAMANAGNCARQAGEPVRAEANWRMALANEPGNRTALAGMADLQFGRGQYLDARAFTERWLDAAPEDAGALRMAVAVEQKLGDNVAASRYLSRLQAISPGPATAPRTQ